MGASLAQRGALGHRGTDDYETCMIPGHWEKLPARNSRVAGCPTCDRDPEGKELMPPHHASLRCESGFRPHCSCDICF